MEVIMFRSRFVKLGAAGFAAVAGVILIVSTVGAHQAHSQARGGLKSFTGIVSSTQVKADVEQDVAEVEADAQADAAAQAAEAQQDAAELAAAQAAAAAEAQQDAAEEAAEAQAEAAEPPETEANDDGSGDKTNETGDNQTEHSDSGTSGSND
jgi:hypothetical protein